MLGFFYGISDKYPKVTRFIKEIEDYLYAPISYDANATQHAECVENALDEDYGVWHGKWVMNERGGYECSICGRVPTAEQKQYDRYCSWCGAKMDQVTE